MKKNSNIIRIEENTLHYKNDFLQLANISEVRLRSRRKPGLLALTLFLAIPFITTFTTTLSFITTYSYLIWFQIAIALVIVAIVLSCKVKEHLLYVTSNSGNQMCFICRNNEFLIRVKNVICESINQKDRSNSQNYTINLDRCQMGDNNQMMNTELGKQL